MTVPNTLPFRFKWVTASPDPHNKTMRNTLEPQEIFIEIEVPVKADYFANAEVLLKEQIGVDVKEPTEPILSPDGMKYALEQLSLQVVAEPISEEEWEEEAEDDSWDEDEPAAEEKDKEEDWDSEDIDWDEE